MDDRNREYLIEEMKAARSRIDAEISAINQFEVLSISAIGAIYVIFFQYNIKDRFGVIFLSLIPVLICAYGLLRYRAHAGIIRIHEKYISKNIESVFNDQIKGGLVRFYDEEKRSALKHARIVFWTIIFLLSFAIFIISVVSPEYITRINPVKAAS